MDIGVKIQKLRQMRGITQEQFADAMQITVQTVSRWENSVTLPDISMLPKLAAFFNTTTDYLLGAEPPESQTKLLRSVETFRLPTRQDAETMVAVFENEEFPRLTCYKITEEKDTVLLEVTKEFDMELEHLQFRRSRERRP